MCSLEASKESIGTVYEYSVKRRCRRRVLLGSAPTEKLGQEMAKIEENAKKKQTSNPTKNKQNPPKSPNQNPNTKGDSKKYRPVSEEHPRSQMMPYSVHLAG